MEKNKRYFQNYTIREGPWSVGLIINLAGMYDKYGYKLKKKNQKKVKSLTIIYITNLSIDQIEIRFNNRNDVPCHSLRSYCGYLPVVLSISGFKSFPLAKMAFLCWKERTRGPSSRICRGIVIYDQFTEKVAGCEELIKLCSNLKPKKNIERLCKYKVTESSNFVEEIKERKYQQPMSYRS